MSIAGERQDLIDEMENILSEMKGADQEKRMELEELLKEKWIELKDFDREVRRLKGYR
ncbi:MULTISPECIES: hypothetical protein [unclassified Mesotoga]|uniref:hypothetical protein n=1 Tax=unclassified Mesotoga TaxID=1184398 RepID=UPI000D506BFA|nr:MULTISPECIES: hypothetical protein [unclassified Mesotoga]PVD18215.1 hypothetical protein V512_015220 [Mesotoga sp. Brook.08.105.5.1]RAO96546.1 hypothetical protein M388_14200 [Mesotoga sp. Brook.08.YT.4.2.5.4.]